MKYLRKVSFLILFIFIFMLSVAGCGKKEEASDGSVSKEADGTADGQESGGEETAIGKDGSFVSSDGKIKMSFPDDSWTCVSDLDNMKTFQSESAVINITYAEGEGIEETMVPSDEEAYRRMVNGGMADLEFDVVSFDMSSDGGAYTYKGIVHYTGADNPDKYTLHYGIYEDGAGYTATAVLSVEDENLLGEVQNAVYSMQVIR